MRIRILREGKPKDKYLQALQADYMDRIGHFIQVRIENHPALGLAGASANSQRRRDRSCGSTNRIVEGLEGSYAILLDPAGREWSSGEFAKWLGDCALKGTRELAFLLGGDRGFPAAVRERGDLLLSLSRMTLTHDWACTLLLEQIYRGFTMLRGYPYAR